MHSVGIAHRDIKPANILLDDRQNLKLIDFGLGNLYKPNQLLETPCGSPCFASPELISGNPYEGEPLDVWSCGVTLYNMIYGKLPFDDRSKEILYDAISECRYSLPNGPSLGFMRMIRKIFVKEPEKRIRFEQIMQDPWFLGQNKDRSIKVYVPSEHAPIIDHKIVLLTCTKIQPVTRQMLEQMIMSREKNRNTLIYYLFCSKAEKNQLTSEELDIIENELNKEKHSMKGETLQSTADAIATASQSKEDSVASPTKKLKRKSVLKQSVERRFEGPIDPSKLPAVVTKKATPIPVRKQVVVTSTKESSKVSPESKYPNDNTFGLDTPAFKSYDEYSTRGKNIVINSKVKKSYEQSVDNSPYVQQETIGRGNKPGFRSVEPNRYREGQNHNEILELVHNTKDRRAMGMASVEPQRNDYYSNNWENPQMIHYHQEGETPGVKKKTKFRVKKSTDHSVEEGSYEGIPSPQDFQDRSSKGDYIEVHTYQPSTQDTYNPFNYPTGNYNLPHQDLRKLSYENEEASLSPTRKPAVKKIIKKKRPAPTEDYANY